MEVVLFCGTIFTMSFFRLVNSGLFSCIDKMIYLVFYTSVVCSDYLVVSVYIQQCFVLI